MSLRHTRILAGRHVPTFARIRRKRGDPLMGLDGLMPIGRHRVNVGKRRRWCYRNARRPWVWRGFDCIGSIGGLSRSSFPILTQLQSWSYEEISAKYPRISSQILQKEK